VLTKGRHTGKELLATRANVSAWWPHLGSINVTGEPFAAHLSRRAKRQWRRSYYHSLVNIDIPRLYTVSKYKGKGWAEEWAHEAPNTDDFVTNIFNKDYPAVEEAIQRVFNGEAISQAISTKIILACGKDSLVVYYNGRHVGRLTPERTLVPALKSRTVRLAAKALGARIEE
jgi:hypothetical protein